MRYRRKVSMMDGVDGRSTTMSPHVRCGQDLANFKAISERKRERKTRAVEREKAGLRR